MSFLRSIIDFIYSVVQSHGWSVILFTILIRLVLFPFDYKSRKSMRKMEKINPQLQALQKKYANDKEKLQRKQAELYKKEKISPLGSCLPMLLTFPILIAMYSVMRNVAGEEIIKMLEPIYNAVGSLTDPEAIRAALAGVELKLESFMWIKNLWVADSPFTSILPTSSTALASINAKNVDAELLAALKTFVDSEPYQNVVIPFFNAAKAPGGEVNFLITKLYLYSNPNGYFLLPLLSGATQFLTTLLTPQQQPAPQPSDDGSAKQPNTGAFMKWFFPIFSVWICATSTASFSLYWVTTNVISILQQFGLKYFFEWQDKRSAEAARQEVDQL